MQPLRTKSRQRRMKKESLQIAVGFELEVSVWAFPYFPILQVTVCKERKVMSSVADTNAQSEKLKYPLPVKIPAPYEIPYHHEKFL
jgi:hypothetical protein